MNTENKALSFTQCGILWILPDAIVNSRLVDQGFFALTLWTFGARSFLVVGDFLGV